MGITLFRRGAPAEDVVEDSPSGLSEDDLRHVAELARALEFKDTGTGAHAQRVQRYAVELADELAPDLLEDRSVEYGFLLHDVGKIGIPDKVLHKPGPLDLDERRLMETHTLLGERMLEDLALLRGEGLRVVRSHHERWDGTGYPDGLAGEEIALGAKRQFDPDVVEAFRARELALLRLHRELDDSAQSLLH